jgi:tetratricopeptide (TPR) repeat protein
VEYEELLAYHLEAAYRFRQAVGLVDERALDVGRRAATRLLAAGRRALAREDVPAAARLLTRARDLLEAAGDAPGVSRADALHELGRALIAAGRLSEASSVLSEATSVAPPGGRLHLEVAVTRLTLELQTNPSASLDAAAEAAADYVHEFEQLDDAAGLAHAWHLVASIEWIRSQVAASEDALSRAVSYARAAGDEQEEATLLGNLTGVALFGLTPVDAGIRRCEHALARARAGQRRILEGRALRALAGMRAMQGDIASARELVGRSAALFDDLGQPLWTAGALQVLGIVERLGGNADAAEKALRESYELLEREGDTSHLSFAAALLARALYDLGRDDEAMTMSEVSERTGAPDDFDTQMQWRVVRAKLLARAGGLEDAVVLAEEAERAGRQTQLHFFADVLMDVGEVFRAAGRREEAAAAMREALAMYESKGNVPSAALARETLRTVAS